MSDRADPRRWHGREPVYALLAPIIVGLGRLVARLRIVGLEHLPRSGPVLVVANHRSHLDPVVLLDVLRRAGRPHPRYAALDDLWRLPVLGWLLRTGRMVRVHRGGGPERFADEAIAPLQAGQALVVYPEGRLVAPGERAPARPGAGMLALRAQVPVVPVAISGLEPYHGGLPRLGQHVTVHVGEPLRFPAGDGGPPTLADATRASEQLLDAIRRQLPAGG